VKVLNLHCSSGHSFEGWFANEEDFLSQQERGLLMCPLCNDVHVSKALSAPRLNLKAAKSSALSAQTPSSDNVVLDNGDLQRNLMRAWLEVSRKMVASTEDVGERFAEEARKMHYGEVEDRGIRGRATPDQVRELVDEGVGVMPLPLFEPVKGTLQ
jgi:hypothetical protein